MISIKRPRNERGSTSVSAVIIGTIASIGVLATGVVTSASIIPDDIDQSRSGACVKAYYASDESNSKTDCIYSDFITGGNNTENPPEENNSEGGVIEDPNAPIMRTTWDTTSESCRNIELPISGNTANIEIDWGGKKTNSDSDGFVSPTLEPNENFKVTTKGYFINWNSAPSPRECLISVDSWGNTSTQRISFQYSKKIEHVAQVPESAYNLTSAFADIESEFTIGKLNTPNVFSMSSMFANSKKFNSPVTVDTSNVESMGAMFFGATSFNQPVKFETPMLTSTSGMFKGATSFNEEISLNTKEVTTMANMFQNATSFNQPVKFETPKLKTTEEMFRGAKNFDSIIELDTSKVESTRYMFADLPIFNQKLDFDMRNASTVAYMFNNAKLYNQDLSHWTMKKGTANAGFSMNATKWEKAKQPTFL